MDLAVLHEHVAETTEGHRIAAGGDLDFGTEQRISRLTLSPDVVKEHVYRLRSHRLPIGDQQHVQVEQNEISNAFLYATVNSGDIVFGSAVFRGHLLQAIEELLLFLAGVQRDPWKRVDQSE